MPADAPSRDPTDAVTARPPARQEPLGAVPVGVPLWHDVEIETTALLKAALPAHRALAACAQALVRTPLAEAATDAFGVLDAIGAVQLDGEPIDPREVLESAVHQMSPAVARQTAALERARQAVAEAPVGSTLALELASVIVGHGVSVRRGAAAASEPGIDAARAPLPSGAERLQMRLEHWQGFVQRDSGDLDPLLMTGTALAEWLAIRPFSGANVRVGWLLAQLLLLEEDLLPAPALPLALHVSRHSDACWQALRETRSAAHPEPWLRFFLGAIEASARDALARLADWEDALAGLPETLAELLPKRPSRALVALCARPSFGIADVIDTGLPRRQTAAAWLLRLVEGGLLRELRVGKEKRFVNDATVGLLLG